MTIDHKARPARPDTPLLRLAAERGWRVAWYDDDGSGSVEIFPGAFLELEDKKIGEEDEDDWTIAVSFRVTRPPATASGLATYFPLALQRAATCILGATEEEIAEVLQQAAPVPDR